MAPTQPSESSSNVHGESCTVLPQVQEPMGANDEPMDPEAIQHEKASYLSLPNKRQVIILCMARLADSVARTSIQSYMFYQLKFFNPSASDSFISTQAGILTGARTAAQVCTGMIWGRLADSELVGRKAVLMVGLVSTCISYIGYGLSRSFAVAVIWQVFGGAMSSNVAIVRCVVAELNPEKRHRARALILLPLFSTAGSLIGPLVGGFLSSNARDGPQETYPYLRPNLFTAAIFLIAAIGVFIWLEETLESLQNSGESEIQRLWKRIRQYFSKNDTANDTAKTTEASPSASGAFESTPLIPKPANRKRKLAFQRIWTFNVVCTLLSHFLIAGHIGTFSILWVMFLSTPLGKSGDQHPPFWFNGGLGMLPRDIGFAMSMLGVCGVILQLLVYPKLQERFGTIRVWRGALLLFPIVYLIAPFPSPIASAPALNAVKGQAALVWVAISIVLILFVLGRTGVAPGTTLLINDCTPHPSVRGTIHSAATVVGAFSRSIFPVAALTIFGQGLKIGIVGLGFWCLAILAVLACVVSQWVIEGSNGEEVTLDDEEE